MKIKSLAIASVLYTLIPTLANASSTEHHHFPGIFIGATTIDSETDFSYGFEYEYKVSKLWGAGFVFEKTDDAHHGDGIDVKLASLYLHPWKELRVGVGFGKEKVGGHHSHEENLQRISVNYDFHVAGFGIAPTIAIDFVDGENATVLGLSFIKSF
ncbi:hypothetical protein CJF42_13050 [Pseudoalteromonas sp. NBT06-2]|uniref:hypothetical protein n=1 Tax=Pseudoalteromonas sp. NBT06-2 TaxID=2025950 RepID=UPI000BA52D63|nr:hypothetical protein [Pseudoalteromonas sp. NBT06-2]PAJ73979.1 hypothetical protein CJF42_13050 [Pseudoalteromonas sp. NBT06-2]